MGFVNGIDATGGIRRADVVEGIDQVFARYPGRPEPAPPDAGAGATDAGMPGAASSIEGCARLQRTRAHGPHLAGWICKPKPKECTM